MILTVTLSLVSVRSFMGLGHRGLFGSVPAPMRRYGGRLILGYQKSAATAAPHRRNCGALKVLKTPCAKNIAIKGEWVGRVADFWYPSM